MKLLLYPFQIILLIFFFITFLHIPIKAQQNNQINGKVVEASNGKALPGASVTIVTSKRNCITDQDGIFKIDDILDPTVTLLVRFIGFKDVTLLVDFSKNSNPYLKIRMVEVSSELKQIEVIGKAEGQQKAFTIQKEASNIKNIVSAEQIRQFPDVNAAEVVQRIPGITIQRDQGEGRYVQLRGTSPEFTNFSINGEQISSPESGARYVGLDVIAADQIDLIEVTKVITPDMDGDGIAGNINIITKSASDTIPDIAASMSGGYNNLMKTGNYQLQFSYGQRVKKFGFQINASYFKNNQGSHNMEYDYTRGPILGQAQDSTEGENFYILYKDIELRHYTITRERIGLSANLDFKPNMYNTYYLRSMFNQFSDNEQRRRIQYEFSDANDLVTYREADITRDLKDRIKNQIIRTINLGAEHQFKNNAKLDYEVSWSEATENQPDRMEASFDNGGITMVIDKSDPKWPLVTFPYVSDSIDAYTWKNYEFNDLMFFKSTVKDQNYTAKINLTLPYQLKTSGDGFIKTGFKIRTKNKTRDHEVQVFNKYFETLPLYSQTAPPLDLTTIEDDFNETILLNDNYLIDHMIGVNNIRSFYEHYPQHFKFDEAETWSETFSEDYIAKENIFASYFMFEHSYKRLTLTGGLRYEITNLNNKGIKAGVDYINGGVLYMDTVTDVRSHHFLLPQLQAKFTLDDITSLRGAITYSYTRPNFDDIIPYREDDNEDVFIGNPELKYPISMNIDFLAERYLPRKGILSGGLFIKKIDNFAFKFTRNAHEGTDFNRFGLKKITMAVNGMDAMVLGAEVQAQSSFFWFDNFLKYFGVYGNYTFTYSEAIIGKRYPQNENDVIFIFDEDSADFFTNSEETETISLPGQAKHTGNLAVYFSKKQWYVKLSGNYHSAFLTELGNDKGLDIYNGQSLHLDFNSSYQFNKNMTIFIDVINLTNAPLRFYMGSQDYFKKQEYYSWWAKAGIKINF